MSRQTNVALAGFGSFLLLALAFLFQSLGWSPCKLCLWQRWPHGAAILLAVLAVYKPQWPWLLLLGAAAALTTAGLALYHTGVEQKLWTGPQSCSGGTPSSTLNSLSPEALLPGAATEVPKIVLCDQFTPFLLGLSMANWNLIASLILAAFWIRAMRPSA